MAPAIMRCKPTVNDRWDRRVIELAAYLYRHGHCNVPEVRQDEPASQQRGSRKACIHAASVLGIPAFANLWSWESIHSFLMGCLCMPSECMITPAVMPYHTVTFFEKAVLRG